MVNKTDQRLWALSLSWTLALSLLLGSPVTCAAKTWTWVSGNSNWMNAANWVGGLPSNLDDVVINNATVELTNDTPILNSLLVTNNAKLYIYSPITNGVTPWGLLVNVTGNLAVAANSWIHPYSELTNGGSSWFLCSNLTIDANSGFDANQKGYAGGIFALDGSYARGHGPGGSLGTLAYSSGGGGYGGRGGTGDDGAQGGSTYGSYTNPAEPGSGSGEPQTQQGRRGGGLVRVQAMDSVLVDGSILANGEDGPGYPGGGSGGGIYLKCRTFKGFGLLKAVGGNDTRNALSRFGGSGGGGRIAVLYDTTAQASASPQPTIRLNAAGGNRTVAGPSVQIARTTQGRPGSLYLSDTQFFSFANIQGGEIMVPGVTSLITNSLSLTNSLILFPAGFNLTVSQSLTLVNAGGIDLSNSSVNIGGDLIINSDRRASVYLRGGPGQQVNIGTNVSVTKGWIDLDQQGMSNVSLGLAGDLTLNESNLRMWGTQTNVGSLNIAGNLLATNGALVYLYGGMTNGLTNYSLLVNVGGNMTLTSNCWVYPYSHNTNGGSVHFRVANLTVNAYGGIDATAKGFAGQFLSTYSQGYGPSHSPAGNSQCTPGAGYGGQGGGSTAASSGGPTYGSSNAPTEPGSGGGSSQNLGSGRGSYGGGLIFVEAASTVLVDGSLLANGESRNVYGGAGSGGAIHISCRALKGAASGLLSANGSTNMGGQAAAGSGGGGGGRIAIWTLKATNEWLGVAQVNGGPGRYAGQPYDGTNGTIFWGRLRDAGTVFVVH